MEVVEAVKVMKVMEVSAISRRFDPLSLEGEG